VPDAIAYRRGEHAAGVVADQHRVDLAGQRREPVGQRGRHRLRYRIRLALVEPGHQLPRGQQPLLGRGLPVGVGDQVRGVHSGPVQRGLQAVGVGIRTGHRDQVYPGAERGQVRRRVGRPAGAAVHI
jgi:hypothetical protein